MEDSHLSYYERELTYFREIGKEFSRKYPKIASRLFLGSGKSEDNHVERLIEAFAFISGRIHKKIDDDFPQLAESLLNIIYPHYINPIPSMTVIQFEPILQNVTENGYEIDRETKLVSKPVGGTPCFFSTCMPVHLWPVSVASAEFKDPDNLAKNAQQAIRIQLKTSNGLNFSDLEWNKLRFFINGQAQHVYHLYELLLNNTCHLECEGGTEGRKRARIVLPQGSIVPVGFSENEQVLPFTKRSFPGYRLLFEYFCFPEKFLFVDFKGLEALKGHEFGDTLSIWIHLDRRAKATMNLDKDTFSLNATTAINLFKKVCEPIRVEHQKTEYRVIPDLRRQNSMEIFAIERVAANHGGITGREVDFKPFYSVRHHLAETDDLSRQVHWHLHRRYSGRKDDPGTEVYLSFVNLDFKPTDPAEEFLTIHALCSNRDLPSRLPFGDPRGDFNIETAAPVAKINCLIKPSVSRRPQLDGNMSWRLISHLALNYLSIVEGGEDALKEILKLYDFDNSPSTRQQIDGIVSVSSEHVTRRVGRSLSRGVKVTIELDSKKFVGSGLYLFSSVLEKFLGQYISVNSFSQLEVRVSQEREVLKVWAPRSGNRILL